MVKNINPWLYLVIAFSVICIQDIGAQKINAAKAFEYLETGNYEKAHAAYAALLKVFPDEELYLYGAGMSLLYLNQDLETAIQYLKIASLGGVPVHVYFFLGKAYHNRCNFAKALQNYQKFKEFGQIMEIRSLKVDQHIHWCENGLKLTNKIHDIDLLFYEKIAKDNLEEIQQKVPGITIITIPASVTPEGKIIKTLVKDRLVPGDQVFFSARGGFFSRNKDIYQVKYLGNNKWGKALRLDKTINTSGNELFPVYDKENNTLYFASGYHESIGGYDLFASAYNEHAMKWMKAENLGIPYNSPSDDLIFIKKGGNHYLTSNRLGGVFRDDLFAVKQPRDRIPINNPLPDLVYDAIRFGISPASHAFAMNKNTAAKTEMKTQFPQHVLEKKYADLLDQAMELQLKADSFMAASREIKNSLTIEHGEKHRLIKKHEDIAARYQVKSEVKYTDAREIEKKLFALNRDKEKENQPSFYREGNLPGEENKDTRINYFEVLPQSPYTANNPFLADVEIPNGVIYRIQLGVFQHPLPYDNFQGLVPVTTEFLEEKELTRYYLGIFNTYKEVSTALEAAKNLGFTDAYIVAYYDQNKISLKRARSIEMHD